ncbi:MAG TPA: LptF/LptG family permease, partial [Chthoniobacterales bacterium]
SLIDAKAPVSAILRFYQIQLPQITVFCLPIALLLGTLYSLSRLSRSQEIVSMVTAGVSIVRVLLPVFVLGFLATAATLALNYKLAPESETKRKDYYDELTMDRKKSTEMNAVLFRNRADSRTWFFEKLSFSTNQGRGIQILQQKSNGDAVWKVLAKRGRYDPATKSWTLTSGEFLELAPDGKIIRQFNFGTRIFASFSETPYQIATTDLRAEDLGVPALKEYLTINADLPRPQKAPFATHLLYRWAMPWMCVIVLLLAGALGIAFSRRGVLNGVVATLVLFFAMLFARSVCLSLGQGGHIPPLYAAWLPVALFGFLGLILLWKRSSGGNLPFYRCS